MLYCHYFGVISTYYTVPYYPKVYFWLNTILNNIFDNIYFQTWGKVLMTYLCTVHYKEKDMSQFLNKTGHNMPYIL